MSKDQAQIELERIDQASKTDKNEVKIRIERWKNSRYWAVWMGQELLAVVLYKKGAVAVRNAILALQQRCSG